MRGRRNRSYARNTKRCSHVEMFRVFCESSHTPVILRLPNLRICIYRMRPHGNPKDSGHFRYKTRESRKDLHGQPRSYDSEETGNQYGLGFRLLVILSICRKKTEAQIARLSKVSRTSLDLGYTSFEQLRFGHGRVAPSCIGTSMLTKTQRDGLHGSRLRRPRIIAEKDTVCPEEELHEHSVV